MRWTITITSGSLTRHWLVRQWQLTNETWTSGSCGYSTCCKNTKRDMLHGETCCTVYDRIQKTKTLTTLLSMRSYNNMLQSSTHYDVWVWCWARGQVWIDVYKYDEGMKAVSLTSVLGKVSNVSTIYYCHWLNLFMLSLTKNTTCTQASQCMCQHRKDWDFFQPQRLTLRSSTVGRPEMAGHSEQQVRTT